jgi:DNA-binding MarR family transcriptional regulator
MNNTNISERYYNLWILLNHTRHAIYRIRELELSRYGITTEQGRLLFVLFKLGGSATPTELSKHLFRQSHTISSLVNRMVAKNLVKRMKDPINKKTVIITLTEDGQDILKQVIKIESIESVMSSLSEREIKQLNKILRVLFNKAMRSHGLENRLFITPEY